MDILDKKTEDELLESLLAEIAKSTNELRCAKDDLTKIQSRISFVLAILNNLINRKRD